MLAVFLPVFTEASEDPVQVGGKGLVPRYSSGGPSKSM